MTQLVRTIFLSDIHLGTRACQAERLLGFLRHYRSERVFLIGDIIDFWAMSRSIHWSPAQNTVVQKVLKRARHGSEVLFIPGNHDEALRDYVGICFGDIRVEREYVHTLADGRRFLIIHGDEYDQVTRHHRWVAVLGDVAYNFLVVLNGWLSRARRLLKLPGYWSLAGYAKRQVKSAVGFIFDFEDSVVHGVRQRGLDGVICGHIHAAAIRDMGGVCYVNCGDWVDSCTGIVEHLDGRLELVEWHAGAADWSEEDDEHRVKPAVASTAPMPAAAGDPPQPAPERALAQSQCSLAPVAPERDLSESEPVLRLVGDNAQVSAFAPRLPEPAIFFEARAFP